MVLNCILDLLCSKYDENQIFGARSSSGWVCHKDFARWNVKRDSVPLFLSVLRFFFLFVDGNWNFFFLWPMFRAGTARNGPKKTNKFQLPSTKRNKQSEVPTKQSGTESRFWRFNGQSPHKNSRFFANASSPLHETGCETTSAKKKRGCNINFPHKKIRFCFGKKKWEMMIILKVFPLHTLPSLSFLSLITTINESLKNEDSNFLFHLYSYQQSSSHNTSVWGKTQVLVDAEFLEENKISFFLFFRKIFVRDMKVPSFEQTWGYAKTCHLDVLISLPHKGMIFRVFSLHNRSFCWTTASSKESSSHNVSVSCCFKMATQLRNAMLGTVAVAKPMQLPSLSLKRCEEKTENRKREGSTGKREGSTVLLSRYGFYFSWNEQLKRNFLVEVIQQVKASKTIYHVKREQYEDFPPYSKVKKGAVFAKKGEFLPMWELSGWQSEHFLISSYGLKTTSRRPKLLFGSSYPFLRKGGKSRKSIFGTRSSSGWVLTHVRTFRMTTRTFFNFVIWS